MSLSAALLPADLSSRRDAADRVDSVADRIRRKIAEARNAATERGLIRARDAEREAAQDYDVLDFRYADAEERRYRNARDASDPTRIYGRYATDSEPERPVFELEGSVASASPAPAAAAHASPAVEPAVASAAARQAQVNAYAALAAPEPRAPARPTPEAADLASMREATLRAHATNAYRAAGVAVEHSRLSIFA